MIKARKVTVKGPRGELTRDFSAKGTNVALDLKLSHDHKTIKAEMWFGNRNEIAKIRTTMSHIQNMITGVTKGYRYKMRLVYAHFPIGVTVEQDGRFVAMRNFLGEKIVRGVDLPVGVDCRRSDSVKDELIIEGNSIELVSQAAANIHTVALVKNKDIRKFLDGAYVSSKGLCVAEE